VRTAENPVDGEGRLAARLVVDDHLRLGRRALHEQAPVDGLQRRVDQRRPLANGHHPTLPRLIRAFVGTHLDATRDDTARWQQAARLIELFGADAIPTILIGDLNARPETRIMQALLRPFTDASARQPAPTSPAENPKARIDFVLLRPATTWRVLSSTVIPEAVASDHRPLLVELILATVEQ
jgi:hypothetical protein